MNDKVLKASDIKQRFPDGSIETVWGDYYRVNNLGQLELALVSLPEFTVRSIKPKAELNTWTSSDLRNSDRVKKERKAHQIVQLLKDARDLAGKTMLYGISMIPIARGTLMTYRAVSPLVKASLTNPYVQTAFAIDGVRNLFSGNGVLKTYKHFRDGEYGKGTLSLTGDILDASGMYGIGKPLHGISKLVFVPANRAAHAYVSIDPVGYWDHMTRLKRWTKSMLTGKYPDIEHPMWDENQLGETTSAMLPIGVKNKEIISRNARVDSWRLYNGLPLKYDTYVQNPDGRTWSLDLEKIDNISEHTFRPLLNVTHDYISSAGGSVDANDALLKFGDYWYGYQSMRDLWDVLPFSYANITDIFPIIEKPFLKVHNVRNKVADVFHATGLDLKVDTLAARNWLDTADEYEQEIFDPVAMFPSESSFKQALGNMYLRLGHWMRPKKSVYQNSFLLKLNKKAAKFEIGTITGGKPFLVETNVPITVIPQGLTKIPHYGWIPNEGKFPEYLKLWNHLFPFEFPNKQY